MHIHGNVFWVPYLALVIICLPFVASSCNRNTPLIFNFGDSNSDTGGFSAATGLEFGYPHGRTFFHRPTGRQTDGRLVIDFLCEYINTRYLSPYLDSFQPDFRNGVNFATCGAAILPPTSHTIQDLRTQLLQFRRFYSLSLDRISQGLLGKEDFRNALYTFDIGQNDLSGSFSSLSYDQVIERIPTLISQIKNAMLKIYELGGRNFWVHNTGPFGCLPRELALRSKLLKDSDLDEFGCIKYLNEGSKIFNTKLNALIQEVRSEMESSTVVHVDMYSIKYDLIANSSSYGFKNPLMTCCGYGGAPYNYDIDRTCLTDEYTVCDKEIPHISWDGTHYTEAANAIVASKILSSHYSSPPLDFNFFCNNAQICSI